MLKGPASLQARLLLLLLGTSLAVWALAAVLAWRDARHELDELLDAHLAQAAALLVAQGAGAGDDEDGVDAPSLHRYAPKVAFQVFHEGRLALRSANAPQTPMVKSDGAIQGFHTVAMQGERWRVFATRGAARDVQVFVGERAGTRDEILWAVLRSVFWPLVIALPLLALAGWWAVRAGLRPLRTLGAALRQRRADDLQPLQLQQAPAEILPLGAALNALFVRTGDLIERERRFTGDAAHELRTPIAAIRAQAQVALAATDDAQRQHALAAMLAGCDRLARLVDQLLTLSRLEAHGVGALQPIDLGAVLRGVIAQAAPASLARGQSLRLDVQECCVIGGDETLLAVLARNVVDNAVRYAPAGARIDVKVQHEGPQVVLTVEDSGAGLADADLARLGQRFFRAMGSEPAGSGLGWSIAQRIAQAHGGQLRADRSPALGGLRACATFPGHSGAPVRK